MSIVIVPMKGLNNANSATMVSVDSNEVLSVYETVGDESENVHLSVNLSFDQYYVYMLHCTGKTIFVRPEDFAYLRRRIWLRTLVLPAITGQMVALKNKDFQLIGKVTDVTSDDNGVLGMHMLWEISRLTD